MLLSCHVALWEIKENRETLKWPTEGKLCWHKKKCPPLSLQRVRSARVRTLRCLAKVSTLGTVHIMVTNGQVSTEKGLARCSELTTYLAALLSHCLMALTMHPHHSNRLVAQALKAVQQVLSGCKQYPTLMLSSVLALLILISAHYIIFASCVVPHKELGFQKIYGNVCLVVHLTSLLPHFDTILTIGIVNHGIDSEKDPVW